MDELDSGRLIWLSSVIDERGKRVGPHRAIVLTSKEQRANGEPTKAVVISSKLNYAPKDEMVKIPWQRGGHPLTGCDRPSAAICGWIIDVEESLITEYGKLMSGRPFVEIAACVDHVKEKRKSSTES